MIKFKHLIHKETGIVIEYENWEKQFKKNEVIVFPAKETEAYWKYNSNTILFSDDFEIIYNSDFTTEELAYLWKISEATEIKDKIADIINKRIEKGRKNNE